MKNRWKYLPIFLLVIFSCFGGKEPIRIGYVNTLTGTASTWGLSSRNGTMLAVEEWNSRGGINGRTIELVFRDDAADVETARRMDQELIDLGVDALIGHYISTVTLGAIDIINDNRITMISTGAGTTDLAGKDDYLFRMLLSNGQISASLGYVATQDYGAEKVAIVYDLSNPGYTETFLDGFSAAFEESGGQVIDIISFGEKRDFSAVTIVGEIVESGADSVCLITNAIEGALLAQHMFKSGVSLKVFSSIWAFADPTFLSNGGRAVEDIVCVSEYNDDSSNPDFIEHNDNYYRRFREKGNHPSKIGYEAAIVLFKALERNSDPAELKETILSMREFEGIDGTIYFDEFGDMVCRQYVRVVRNGQLKTVKEYLPENYR